MKRVHEAAEKAWHEWLATRGAIEVNLPFMVATDEGPIHLSEPLSAAHAKRVFAGDGFSEEFAAARAEHERDVAAKRQARESRERVEASEQRIESARSRKIMLIVVLVVVAFTASAAALLTIPHSHEDHDQKARSTEHR